MTQKKVFLLLFITIIALLLSVLLSRLFREYVISSAGIPTAPQKVVHIGISKYVSIPSFNETTLAIKKELERSGYIEGKNIIYDIRSADGNLSIARRNAEDFMNADYDVIVTTGTIATVSASKVVHTTPIVFTVVLNPIIAGIVNSLHEPGGNVTGASAVVQYEDELKLIKRLFPKATRIGVPYNPDEPNAIYALDVTYRYAKALGLTVVTQTVFKPADVERITSELAPQVDVLYMIPDSTLIAGQAGLVRAALAAKKPIITVDNSSVKLGALASIGPNYEDTGRRTARIIKRILNGENPGDIPVDEVASADLFFNTDTAKLLGVTIPPDLLLAARVIYSGTTTP